MTRKDSVVFFCFCFPSYNKFYDIKAKISFKLITFRPSTVIFCGKHKICSNIYNNMTLK